MRTGGLLAVHAHPDDETLSTGALLATWAAAGGPVTVVTCTRGEQGEVIGAELAHLEGDGPALAAHREGELAAALDALGVSDHIFLDEVTIEPADAARDVDAGGSPQGFDDATARYVDSGMAWVRPGHAGAPGRRPAGAFVDVPLDSAAGRLAAVIVQRRPDVVVGYEPGGGYGHPDHVRAHDVMQRAVELAARGGAVGAWEVPVVLWAVQDEQVLRAAREQLVVLADGPVTVASTSADRRLVPAAPHEDVPSCAVTADEIDVEVDVTAVLERLTDALLAHATQVQGVRTAAQPQTFPGRPPVVGWFALSNDVLQPLLATETYRYASGRPAAAVRWPAGIRARVR